MTSRAATLSGPTDFTSDETISKSIVAIERFVSEGALAAALHPSFCDAGVRPLRSQWDFVLDETKFQSQDMFMSRRWKRNTLKQLAEEAVIAYEQRPAIRPAALAGLRLGRCVSHWFSQGWPKSRDLAWCLH